MKNEGRRRLVYFAASAFGTLAILVPSQISASTSYTYDQLDRLATAVYDNGLCVAYFYDANGNRTSQTNTISGPQETPVWGAGTWGCFRWTP